MSVNQPGGLSNAALTQSIIIALVAGSILTAGVMSVMYRRRRRMRFLAQLPGYRLGPGGRLIRILDMDGDGAGDGGGGVGGRGGGDRRKNGGRKPKFWDVWVGEGDEVGIEGGKDGGVERGLKREVELDVEGKLKGDWKPLGLSYTGNDTVTSIPAIHPQDTQIEMTVLIAMPFFDHPTHHRDISSSTSSTSSSLHKSQPLHDYPILYENPLGYEREELPVLELATTSIPVIISKDEEKVWAGLTEGARRQRKPEDNEGASSGTRIVRTDGFGPR